MQNDAADTGMVRLFNFLTPAGRGMIAPLPREENGGLVFGVELDHFLATAASPAVGAMDKCHSVRLVGEPTINQGSMTRGALGQQLIEVLTAEGATEQFLVKLEQQRRPPLEGCWTVQELFVLKLTVFQELLLEGEELDGEDAPGGMVEKDGQ